MSESLVPVLFLTDEEVWLEIYKAYAVRDGIPRELVTLCADQGLSDFRNRFRQGCQKSASSH